MNVFGWSGLVLALPGTSPAVYPSRFPVATFRAFRNPLLAKLLPITRGVGNGADRLTGTTAATTCLVPESITTNWLAAVASPGPVTATTSGDPTAVVRGVTARTPKIATFDAPRGARPVDRVGETW